MSDKYAVLRAAAENATPGPWEYYHGNTSIEYNVQSMEEDQGSVLYVNSGDFTQKQTDRNGEFIAAANPATILELLAERDADKRRIADMQTIVGAAEKLVRCKGRYHSEQNYRALATLFGVTTPDLPPLELEARTLTVKLPQGYVIRAGHPINEGERHVMVPKNGGDWLSSFDVEHALLVAGISAQPSATISNSADFAIDKKDQVTAPVSTVVPDDYFTSLVSKARPAAEKAMRKFPQPNYVLLKVAEEAGEVVQAGVHYAERRMSWEQVEGEIVQLLAMLIRLVTEGDQINGVTPPEHTRAAAPQQEANQ